MFIHQDLTTYIFIIPAALAALMLREWVKARCSSSLGDPTPGQKGMLGKGNPFRFIEPIGLFCTIIFGFGWGRPTPVSPLYYKDRKKGILITHLMPILAGLITGALAAVLAGALAEINSGNHFAANWGIRILSLFANTSVAIALFNLIPIYPLDGAKILQLFISANTQVKMTQNEKILQLMLVLLMILGVISMAIHPITYIITRLPW